MAVSDQWQGHGLGAMVLQQLEQVALEQGMPRIILNARDTAAGFYQKAGYSYLEPATALFGIGHHRYVKLLLFLLQLCSCSNGCQSYSRLFGKRFHSLLICN